MFMDSPGRDKLAKALHDSHHPAANTDAVVSLDAGPNDRIYVPMIAWSYDGAPTGGRLTVTGLEGGEDLVFDITAGGPGAVHFPPMAGASGTDITVTLAAGGAAVTGKLSVFYAVLPARFDQFPV